MPFVQDQVQKGHVLERLAAYGVDALVNSVSKHKDNLAEDVKALTRASMDKALPELEQLLHRRLQALSTAMEKGADDKQGVVADLRQAAKAQKPEERAGDLSVTGVKQTTTDHQNQQDHWHDARHSVAEQLGNLADETVDLVIKQSGQLEAVKPIFEDSIREVMDLVVKEGALFAARHNGEQCDDVNALEGGTVLTEQLPAFLTTATVELMVELLSDRLQSG
ncbi:hypothetical protein, partial [Endozoicomonas acroporae]|uniref:hypothetical protein n=1 Tax=Endozoicomonas acroporae TaxID=1701104 RepID=UPI003D79707B